MLACASLHGQVDSLLREISKTPDSLVAPLYVKLQEAMNTPQDDTTGMAYALRGVQLAEEFADSVSLPGALYYLNRRLLAKGDSLAADSVWIYRRRIISSHGYSMKYEFSNSWNNMKYLLLYQGLMIWTDSSGNTPAETVLSPDFRSKFGLNFTAETGLDSSLSYWVRMRVRGTEEVRRNILFMPNQPNALWDSVSFYTYDRFDTWKHELAGQDIAIDEKPTKNWLDIFEVPLAPEADYFVYFRLKGFKESLRPSSIQISLIEDSFLEIDAKESQNILIFLWVFLFQLVFFGLLYLATRDREYIPYLFYLLGIVLFAVTGLWFTYFFPQAESFFFLMALILSSWISGLGLLRFSERFLNIHELLPKWKKVSGIFLVCFVIVPALMLLGICIDAFIVDLDEGFVGDFFYISLPAYFFLFTVELIMLAIMGILAWRKGYTPALYYLIALFFLLGSVGLVALIPLFDLYYLVELRTALLLVQAGVMLQSCFFSLGIGHKRSLLEKEKLQAQETLNEELAKVNTAFGRFVPHTFLKAIGRGSVLDVELGDGVEKEVTVFFSDIRDYTTLSENMTPKENFRFLNSYLGRVGPIITDHEGFVNQYYGDGIMAIFVDTPADALKAAIYIQEILRTYNKERKEKGRVPISMGLGLHRGLLMMGVIGDTLRMEAGVVSDTVNTASRMEGLTKYFGCNLVVSEEIIKHPSVYNKFKYRLLGKVQVKGRKEPITIYDCFGGDAPEIRDKKINSLASFERGMSAYYSQNFIEAAKSFDESLLLYPGDTAAEKYLTQCHDFIANGVPEFWDGIEALQKK